MQQKGFSLLSRVIWVERKVLLQFGDDFCTACEPIAGVWHEGNDPIGHRTIAVVDLVDVHLPDIHTISLLGWYLTVPLTVLAV